jgi:predicted ribosome quality control (RQC) complex YloA/Tae2 family protein
MLTFKKAAGGDLWLHTKDIPGAHVILFTEGREAPSEAVFEAAAIAAWHSKGRASENVPVDYTLAKYVKKPAGARPGMVIFTNNKTLYVKPSLPVEDRRSGE